MRAHRPISQPVSPRFSPRRVTRLLSRAGLLLGTGWLAACASVSAPPGPAAQRADDGYPRAAAITESDAVRVLDAAALSGADQSDEVVVSGDLWDRIRAGFAMPELDSPLVAEKERYYLSRPDYLQRMFSRGSRYLHHIVEEIEKRGMPTELALLPFVESAMNPTALSSAKAAGLWQFIPSTGRHYDLKQNWWVDNRRDVVHSTRAALDYLQAIYKLNDNDWFLALASYNWGEGSVRRAVRANQAAGRPAGYAHLRMPTETRHYVPKLLALKHLVQNADRLGLQLPALPDEPYFATIEKTRPIDLKLAASFAGMTEAEFLALNPAHNRPVISATRNNTLKIPVDRLEQFKTAMAAHAAQKKPFVSWQPYTMQAGDQLATLAARGGLSSAELLRANGISPNTQLLAGTRLLVPTQRAGDERLVEAFNGPRIYQRVNAGPLVHTVRRGETGSSIARRYGLTLTELRSMNRRISPLRPGMRLVVRRTQQQTVLVAEDGRRQVISRQASGTRSAARSGSSIRLASHATGSASRPASTISRRVRTTSATQGSTAATARKAASSKASNTRRRPQAGTQRVASSTALSRNTASRKAAPSVKGSTRKARGTSQAANTRTGKLTRTSAARKTGTARRGTPSRRAASKVADAG
ncbi:MAG: transglycosylase SLT domain-containing protein [Lautropia sp.]|nr:transglycosylase SLT domain-containing protein [Lautropia sp.]